MKSKVKREKLYVIYSKDKYELPVVTGSSPLENKSQEQHELQDSNRDFQQSKEEWWILGRKGIQGIQFYRRLSK